MIHNRGVGRAEIPQRQFLGEASLPERIDQFLEPHFTSNSRLTAAPEQIVPISVLGIELDYFRINGIVTNVQYERGVTDAWASR